MLYHERKRLQEIEAGEAVGEIFWTDKFEVSVCNKIWFAFTDAAGRNKDECIKLAHVGMVRSLGVQYLYSSRFDEHSDLKNFVLSGCVGDDDVIPSVIEMMYFALHHNRYMQVEPLERFDKKAQQILRNARISFDLIAGQMVPFESREMHMEIVAPMLHLLTGRPDLKKAEKAYQDALKEISTGTAADAITDAGVALQETLEALGCDGNALGPLIKSAKTKRLLAPHDQKIMDWVSADRSESGDSHHASDAVLADAWLAVHVVGALILRLADADRRGEH